MLAIHFQTSKHFFVSVGSKVRLQGCQISIVDYIWSLLIAAPQIYYFPTTTTQYILFVCNSKLKMTTLFVAASLWPKPHFLLHSSFSAVSPQSTIQEPIIPKSGGADPVF
jgi:hypothetical protein